ncbi:MAG TPA: phosphatase PAP2 family protein [Acidimicrobiales bacterium]|nr:phosphatase PAP2 family protein [Acidimicrobiales bacterium]
MKFLAVYGVGIFALLVFLAWRSARHSPNAPRAVAATVWAAFGTVAAVGINQMIVATVHRARPYAVLSGIETLVTRSHDPSFPSDHALTAGAATAGLWIIAHYTTKSVRVIAIVASVLSLLVAFARVYVGAHYPSDVIVGLAIGAVIMLIGWFLLGGILTYIAKIIAKIPLLRSIVSSSSGPYRRRTFSTKSPGAPGPRRDRRSGHRPESQRSFLMLDRGLEHRERSATKFLIVLRPTRPARSMPGGQIV